MCKGRIALWAVQSAFTCHHCRWELSSNVRSALARAVLVAGSVELLLGSLLWWYSGSASLAFTSWAAAGYVVAFGVGWIYVKHSVRLVSLHPPRAVTSNPSLQPTAFGGG
jgi:hypothetical protein